MNPNDEEIDNTPAFRGSFAVNSTHENSVRALADLVGVEAKPLRDGQLGARLVRVTGEKRNERDFDDYALDLATQIERILTHPGAAEAIRDIDWFTVRVTLLSNNDMNASFIAPPPRCCSRSS